MRLQSILAYETGFDTIKQGIYDVLENGSEPRRLGDLGSAIVGGIRIGEGISRIAITSLELIVGGVILGSGYYELLDLLVGYLAVSEASKLALSGARRALSWGIEKIYSTHISGQRPSHQF